MKLSERIEPFLLGFENWERIRVTKNGWVSDPNPKLLQILKECYAMAQYLEKQHEN